MTRLFKTAFAVGIVCVVLLISLVVLIRFQGKALIEKQAGAIFRRPVTIDQARFVFPAGVHLTDFNIEGLLFVPEVQVRCDFFALLGGGFRLVEVKLEAPVLTLHLSRDHQILWSWHDEPNARVESKKRNVTGSQRGIKAIIQKLTVSDGIIDFPNHEQEDSLNVSLQKIALTALNVPLSGQSMEVCFSVAGTIVNSNDLMDGVQFKGSGFLNWPKRSMDADFTAAKAQDNMDVQVHLSSRNNDMMVRGHLKTARSTSDNPEQPTGWGDNLLTAAVQKAGLAVDMNFSFPMKMDRWELRNVDFSGNLSASQASNNAALNREEMNNSGQ